MIIAGIDITKQISAGEILAIVVSIVGGLIALGISSYRRRKDKNRKLRLILFPDKWGAYRRTNQNILEIQIFAEVFIPHHSATCWGFAEIEGKIVQMEFSKPQHGTNGRWVLVGTTALSPISQQAKTVEASMVIELDGEIKKSSGKRIISIIDS